ncbi:MAG TPA: metal-sensing transcriptional repressor [Anaerolineae bacterium]|nr:metal-sensing transcriptional repressor [Anaerolineae bacterium]
MGQTGHLHRQTKAIANRLSRIEGHVRSIKAMVEEGRDCSDVLVQIAAVRAAVNQVGRIVLEDHLESCLLEAAREGDPGETWADLKKAFDVFF